MGSRHWPMWYEITACEYNSNKNFGFKNTGNIRIKVGSSKSNSHPFLVTTITRRFKSIIHNGEAIKACVFTYSVDNVVLKIAVFTDNDGKAGNFLFDKTNLDNVEPLKL